MGLPQPPPPPPPTSLSDPLGHQILFPSLLSDQIHSLPGLHNLLPSPFRSLSMAPCHRLLLGSGGDCFWGVDGVAGRGFGFVSPKKGSGSGSQLPPLPTNAAISVLAGVWFRCKGEVWGLVSDSTPNKAAFFGAAVSPTAVFYLVFIFCFVVLLCWSLSIPYSLWNL